MLGLSAFCSGQVFSTLPCIVNLLTNNNTHTDFSKICEVQPSRDAAIQGLPGIFFIHDLHADTLIGIYKALSTYNHHAVFH
jgi:hypothetical protein